MTKWILIIYIGSDLWVPMLAYNTEEECLATLARWEVIPPTHGTCLPGVIEPEKRKRKRRD
jgi:hypothetical protein